MKRWPIVRLAILLALIGAFGWVFFRSGSIGAGHRIAELETPYKTERDWARQQTVADIDEMAAFAERRPPSAIASSTGSTQTPWEPSEFVAFARTAFKNAAAESSSVTADYYPQLTSVRVDAFASASDEISKALGNNMRDPRAHEAAALVIGAFALRDAADLFTDVRWAMNRMTAHLAVAGALRGDSAMAPDGLLATIILAALSNHQARAMSGLQALGTGTPPEPLNAWIRALTLRVTHDWRTLADPSAVTRLEKLEYFRARRATVRRRLALEELEKVGAEVDGDFARIAQDSQVGVEDGGVFIDSGLELELAEAAEAHRLVRQQPMPVRLADALNHRASRLITDGRPAVLPWGAWAEFYQRHIAMNIGLVDSHYRHMLGLPEKADRLRDDLDRQLGELTYFPLGTLRRTKGRAGTEADLKYVARVVDLSAESPEIVTCPAWIFFETGSHSEPIPTAMSKASAWFATATKDVPYEAGVRSQEGMRVKATDLNALIEEAPHDALLLKSASVGPVSNPVVSRARGFLSRRYDYDLVAIDAALEHPADEAERAELLEKACVLSSRDCSKYAALLASAGRTEEAAKKYEQAFADPKMDAIAVANDSAWLIDHYFKTKRAHEAIELADRAAGTGAAAGLWARGYLLERMGSLDEAERDFLESAERYKNPAQLIGFYHRRVFDEHKDNYKAKYDKWIAEVFPRGMQAEPETMTSPPKAGVFVNKDSERSKKAGIRAGDIIVALEGWRVESFAQYAAINAFKEDPHVKMTIWRGSVVKVDAIQPGRLFGTELADYPLKGYIQP